MEKDFADAMDIIRKTKVDIYNICENSNCVELDSEGIRSLLYELINEIERVERESKYFFKNTMTGHLKENSNSKFEIVFPNEASNYTLNCGDPIELYIENDWYVSKVQYKLSEGYFFKDDDYHIILCNGMRARIRV